MDLLVLLHERRGAVVSATEILDRVWGGAMVSSHSIAIVISDLRRALGDSARSPRFLETIPKRGYRLLPDPLEVPGEGGARPTARRPRSHRTLGAVLLLALAALAITTQRSGRAEPALRNGSPSPGVELRYAQARQLEARRDPGSARVAGAMLERAIEADPQFAPGYAALADLYVYRAFDPERPAPLESFRMAEQLVAAGFAIDPAVAELWVSRGRLSLYRDHDLRAAAAAFDRALALDPSSALAWQGRATVSAVSGRATESLEAIRRARDLDPASTAIAWDEVWFSYLAGDQDASRALADAASRVSPPNFVYRALIADAQGRSAAAIRDWLDFVDSQAVEPLERGAIERLVESQRFDAAYAALAAAVEGRDGVRPWPLALSLWKLRAGDRAGASTALAEAPADRNLWLWVWLHRIPAFGDLLEEPAVRARVRREWPGDEPLGA